MRNFWVRVLGVGNLVGQFLGFRILSVGNLEIISSQSLKFFLWFGSVVSEKIKERFWLKKSGSRTFLLSSKALSKSRETSQTP